MKAVEKKLDFYLSPDFSRVGIVVKVEHIGIIRFYLL